ncbi:MAG: hypothetical protein R6X02_19985 [Enhygromyxa sp.]
MNSGRETIQVAFVVALAEEFRVLHEYVGEWTPHSVSGIEDFRFDIPRNNDGGAVTCVACLIGDMGPGHAGDATHRVIDAWNPAVIVNIGIAASLKPDDLKIGDVAVVSMAKEYAVKSKVSEGKSGIHIEPGGDYFNADPRLTAAVHQFEFSNKKSYLEWRSECANRLIKNVPSTIRDKMIVEGHLRAEPAITKTSLASGPIVGAAAEFREWVVSTDRNIKALEMEAAGVLRAVASRPTVAKAIVIRGISDFADNKKTELDQIAQGTFRRNAMWNCLDLLWRVIRSGRLERALGLGVDSDAPPLTATAKSSGASSGAEAVSLAVIKASVTSLDVSVTQLAMQTLAHAREVGDEEIARWLDRELEGYANTEESELPSYRCAPVTSRANLENSAKRISGFQIPMQNLEANIREKEDLPEHIRSDLANMVAEQNTFKVRSGLAEAEAFARRSDDDTLRSPWPDQLMSFTLPFIFNLTPTSAWQVVPPIVFRRVIDAVRKRIFDYVFPLPNALNNEDDEMPS